VYARYWVALVVVALIAAVLVALAPIIAAIARALWVTTRRQLSTARTILQGGKEET
jgi:hypothetical protein